MSLVFDCIILLVAVLAIYLGVKRGFVKSIMGMFTLIAALFVAYAFTPVVSPYIENTAFIREIGDGISETIQSLSKNEDDTYDLSKLFGEMPEPFRQILDRYGADADALTEEVTPQADATSEHVEDLVSMIADPVTGAVAGVLAFFALFVGALIALKLLTWVLDLVFQLPVLKTANTLLGFVFGLVSALLWAWMFSSLSVMFINAMSSISPDHFSKSIIDNTVILRFFANDGFSSILRMVIG